MDALQVIAPLIGLVLGGAVTGVGVLFRQRAEQKRAIGVALADLLEIRHNIGAMEHTFRFLKTKVSVPDEVMPVLANLFESMLGKGDSLHKRYDETISLVAGV